ncbi:peroxiredoxin family protein [Desulfosoma caldarium]|uniref:Redoxin n=1 Tax=Desulfosoma caldarium TaxID=610254 RepID=A0A3N1VKE3_9BACT|nr:TlpA disulfide reductase family protein [Desulfosoma caldarium]ROR03284.1 redoxin [Desulfosoma caldarium]
MRRLKTFPAKLFVLLLFGACLAWAGWAHAESGLPDVGGTFPSIALEAPKDPAMRDYLGLGEAQTFTVDQVDADLVVVEIFSMYCPYCQREAPVVNAFYELAQKKNRPGKTVKILGIGAGNTAFEVDVFAKKYKVPFPLIADGDYSVHKTLGQVRTPYFIAVRRGPDGKRSVVYSQAGSIGSPEDFYRRLMGP